MRMLVRGQKSSKSAHDRTSQTLKQPLFAICLLSCLSTWLFKTPADRGLSVPPQRKRMSGLLHKMSASPCRRDFERLNEAAQVAALESTSRFDNVDRCTELLWRQEHAATSVEILIASKDRPQELRNTLLTLLTFVQGVRSVRVTVLFSASSGLFASAYMRVQELFEGFTYVERGEEDYFEKLHNTVRKSPATNFVIMSDDTNFFRSCDIRGFATLQNLLEHNISRTRISVQLRASSRDERPPALGQILPSWGMPHSHILNCTRGLWDSFFSSCYDRQIDGAMFTRATLTRELDDLKTFRIPSHPGELEGNWIDWASSATWRDLTIIPVDRVLMNVGLGIGTVRKDREGLEKNLKKNYIDREEAAQDILNDCFREVKMPDAYFKSDTTHDSFELQRRCMS